MTVKERLHLLVDLLPDSEVEVAERVLEALSAAPAGLPAFLRNAPADDEPYTDEERAAVEEAYEAIRRGEVLSDEPRRQRGSLQGEVIVPDSFFDPLPEEEQDAWSQ
ncbi:MAG: hypothetical protein AB1941_18660 [Gemmatimonadota bacterium]